MFEATNNNQPDSETKFEPDSKRFKQSQTIDENIPISETMEIWRKIYDIERRMSAELKPIPFLPEKIASIYNPIEYASDLHCAYLKKFLNASKKVLFIEMNSDFMGMVQTGVPFGHVPSVRDWMKLSGTVNKPPKEIACRPVKGLQYKNIDQSGERFWGLMKELCGDNAEDFFRNCFVYTYCPLAFLGAGGNDVPLSKLKLEQKHQLQAICSKYLKEVIDVVAPEWIIPLGRWTEQRVEKLFKDNPVDSGVRWKGMFHPRPEAKNNFNWNEKAKKWLIENDVLKYLKSP